MTATYSLSSAHNGGGLFSGLITESITSSSTPEPSHCISTSPVSTKEAEEEEEEEEEPGKTKGTGEEEGLACVRP